MSISIYYQARRPEPLTATENASVAALIEKYSVDDQIGRKRLFRKTPNWESFCVYGPPASEPGVIFEGATKLPDNSDTFTWQGLQHWCSLLSELRLAIPTAKWEVRMDDLEIPWNEEQKLYAFES